MVLTKLGPSSVILDAIKMFVFNANLRRIFLFILGLVPLITSDVYANQANLNFGKLQKFFEWGEYDSLISHLEPALEKTLITDSISTSKIYTFLGVAYFAKGRIADSRNCFILSYRLDKNITLDKLYVSPEIYSFFQDAIREGKELSLKEAITDSIMQSQESEITNKNFQLKRIEYQKRGQRYINYSTALFTTSILSSILAYVEYRNAQGDYEKLSIAAQTGELNNYTKYKSSVKIHDMVHVGSIFLASVGSISGGYFLKKVLRLKKENVLDQNNGGNSAKFTNSKISDRPNISFNINSYSEYRYSVVQNCSNIKAQLLVGVTF